MSPPCNYCNSSSVNFILDRMVKFVQEPGTSNITFISSAAEVVESGKDPENSCFQS